MTKETYEQLLQDNEQFITMYFQKDNKLSKWRLITFIIFVIFLVISFFMPGIRILLILLMIISMIAFITLVIIHRDITETLNKYKFKKEVINEYLDRFSNNWHKFKNDGNEFDTKDNQNILSDLDIIGNESLYKFLCIAKTKEGKNKLIKRLSNNYLPQDELITRQKSIKDIIENIDFSLDYQVALKQYEKNFEMASLTYLKSELNKEHKQKKLPLILNILITTFTYLSLLLLKINFALGLSTFFFFLIINFIFAKIFAKKNQDEIALMNELSVLYNLYSPMINCIQNAKFTDETLFKYQYRVLEFDKDKNKKIKQFSNFKIYQNNILACIIVNGLFPFTTTRLKQFSNFITDNKQLLLSIPDVVSTLEELVSLAIIGQVKQNTSMPSYLEERKIIFENLTHPLINEDVVIGNDFSTKCETTIITGSNMSGKTSFLRTIGINLILMQAGTVTTSKSFSASYFKIFTSMRITDDISKGISSFYRELLRIKEAIDYAKTKKPMIALIDEVFRGTNANDRITGAIAMIKFLQMKNVILLITTHDQQLCTIENVNLNNYYFSEYYEDDQIKFDYKIKEGICPTTNALYLMKLAGIIK